MTRYGHALLHIYLYIVNTLHAAAESFEYLWLIFILRHNAEN